MGRGYQMGTHQLENLPGRQGGDPETERAPVPAWET